MRIFKKIYTYLLILIIGNFLIADELTIRTSSGISTGIEKNGVITWNDLPYAKPPIKDLRWKAPKVIK